MGALSAYRLVSLKNVELEPFGMCLKMGLCSKIILFQIPPLKLSEDDRGIWTVLCDCALEIDDKCVHVLGMRIVGELSTMVQRSSPRFHL